LFTGSKPAAALTAPEQSRTSSQAKDATKQLTANRPLRR
jgi:hypothetical protein